MKIIYLNIAFVIFALLATEPADARQKRSTGAKNQFKSSHPCPANGLRRGPCPGYVIDHIIPLACNGADAPANMQWQTIDAAKQKDKWERKSCR